LVEYVDGGRAADLMSKKLAEKQQMPNSIFVLFPLSPTLYTFMGTGF
jgi:hypothetical protein